MATQPSAGADPIPAARPSPEAGHADAGAVPAPRPDGPETPATGHPTARHPTARYVDELAGRHLVFLNWRDREHPQAGGAELFCHSIAERFAAAGAKVTLLTARPPGAAASAVHRGVAISRGGGTFGVYPSVLARLARMAWTPGSGERRPDAVIDCQNGIPFFSPLVLPPTIPVVQVLHHVHQKQFPLFFPPPVARFGQFLETPCSPWVYGRRPVAVVSPSTRDEVRTVLRIRGPRFLVPNGVSTPLVPTEMIGATAGRPTIVCVGRLVPHKRLHLLIEAIPALAARHPGLVVHIVGDGPDRERLVAVAEQAGVAQGDGSSRATLRWHGFADAARRDALLSSAWLTVNPSQSEGWGLSVLEANALGVPAVAVRVPGLRDAVRDGVTGWLVDDPAKLTDAIDHALTVLSDPAEAARWRTEARAWAAGFTWEASAELLAAVILSEIDRLALEHSASPRPAGSPGRPDDGPGAPPVRRRALGLRRPALNRRRQDDNVTRVEFTLPPGAPLPALRRTDLIYEAGTAADGRSRLVVAVLYGADNVGARAALARCGLRPASPPRPATDEELLLAAARSGARTAGHPTTAATGIPAGAGAAVDVTADAATETAAGVAADAAAEIAAKVIPHASTPADIETTAAGGSAASAEPSAQAADPAEAAGAAASETSAAETVENPADTAGDADDSARQADGTTIVPPRSERPEVPPVDA